MDIEFTSTECIIKMPHAVKYNADLTIDLAIVIAARYYWKIQGDKLYNNLRQKYKGFKKINIDRNSFEYATYIQYKELQEMKKALSFFKDKELQEIMDMPFNTKDSSKYNKHINQLFNLRKTMWI